MGSMYAGDNVESRGMYESSRSAVLLEREKSQVFLYSKG